MPTSAGPCPPGLQQVGAPSTASHGHYLYIFLVRTVITTGQRIVYPFLPSIARGLGVSLQAASMLVSLRVVAGMWAPVLGPLGERHGRRRTMVLALVLFTMSCALLARTEGLALAAFAFVLLGLTKALYDPSMYAFVGDTVPYQQRGRITGLLELSWSCAWLIGVPIAGLLIERFGWHAPWAVLAFLGLAGAWLTHNRLPIGFRVRRAPDGAEDSPGHATQVGATILSTWKSLLRRRTVVALLVTSLLFSAAIECPFIVYGAWLESSFGLSLAALGLASTVVGVAEAAAEVSSSLFTDRVGKRRCVLIGLVGLACSLLMLPWLSQHGLAGAMVGVALVFLTFEFGIVSLLPMATELAPDRRASLLSLNVTALSLGRIVGAAAGSQLWRLSEPGIAPQAAVGAGCALGAALIVAIGMPEVRPTDSGSLAA